MRNGNNNIGYQVENLFAENQVEKAIRLLIESLENTGNDDLYDDALRTAKKYIEIRRYQRLDTVHQDFAAIQISRIMDRFLQINLKAFGSNGADKMNKSTLDEDTPKISWVNKAFTRIKSLF